MSLEVLAHRLSGLLEIKIAIHGDARGRFFEVWKTTAYESLGLGQGRFVQDNISVSKRDALRGLHAQFPSAQGKLISVLEGEIFDVAVDLRRGSPTFGEWMSFNLKASEGRQVFVPPGFAHGFLVRSESAIFAYKCTNLYVPHAEFCVRWDDPQLNIPWPTQTPQLSDKDQRGYFLKDLPPEKLMPFEA